MNKKCEICGRFLKSTDVGLRCKVHGENWHADRARIEDPINQGDLFNQQNDTRPLSAEECAYHVSKGKTVEIFVKFKTSMARSEGKWMKSDNTAVEQFKKAIDSGSVYRLKPEPKKEKVVIHDLRPTESKSLDELNSDEIEALMAKTAEIMAKFGTAVKLPSGKTILMMEVD